MFEQKITFDSFIRSITVLCLSVGAVWLLNTLSSVLLPFFIAWLLAYLLYPLVRFIQHRLRLRNRILSIVVALLFVFALLAGFIALIVPPIIKETIHIAELTTLYFHDVMTQTNMSKYIQNVVDYLSNKNTLVNLVQQSSFIDAMQTVMLQTWNVVSSTVNVALSVLGVFVVLLYMFFILVDYEKICQGWVNLIPAGKRDFASMVVQDVKNGMNAYFRGQSLIALIVGILFSIGFLIIDFPLAIGLGLFIGLLNLVPYMQLFGFIPTILLAILKATETGESFWFIMLCALAVFAVVQLIQDMYLTPRIMGHVMGLNPAIILLSLSIWGSLMGIIGLIIALPLTTLLLSYYRRFILKEVVAEAETEQKTEEDAQKSEENE
ncbi:MAG: AI-2E family transporter [Bacteroidaceae bacterium]|jgi:predicted PurR-regulated permease PerM|nr:AI-2E family transporter [Bacteroidaceae bacterium]